MLNPKKSGAVRGSCGCINRRSFLYLTLAAACSPSVLSAAASAGMIDAGPVHDYSADGVYSKYQDLGFFVIRKDGKLRILSSICTHKKCKLTAESDRSFSCECHGSTFDPNGKVTEGPAKRDLPVLSSSVDARGHLIVMIQ